MKRVPCSKAFIKDIFRAITDLSKHLFDDLVVIIRIILVFNSFRFDL